MLGRAKPAPPPQMKSFGFSEDALMEIGTMVAGLFALHAVALLFVPAVHTEFAKKPHLAAHFVATLVGFAALAAFGTTLWLSGVATGDEDCVTNHISGYCEGGARIAHGMMAFQTYEVLLALYVPKLRGPSGDMLVHHLATLSLATLGAGYGYLHFYAPFFFGLTELSSVPLAFMDLFKFYPAIRDAMPVANENVRVAFVAVFIPMRLMYWPYVCSEFWKDSLNELNAEQARQPAGVILIFLVANILLTGLQFFWGSLIVKGIVKKIKGQKGE
jgi:hypothetical protein